MTDPIRSELRRLRLLTSISLVAVAVLTISAFRQDQRARFTEIDVERINIVEPDGKLRMVLSNRPRSTGPIYKGQPFGYEGGSRPGMIFFNDEGTENGGLTFTGRQNPDGRYQATSHFAFDQFNQDQVLYLQYRDENGQRRLGLTVGDRAHVDIFDLVKARDSLMRLPDTPERAEALRRLTRPREGVPLFAPRVFLGRDVSRAAVLILSDPQGRPRLRLRVDSTGTPAVEFLDESGQVTDRLPRD